MINLQSYISEQPSSQDKFQICEFHGILHVFVNFTDLLEICGSVTVQNIRSPV